MRRRVLTIAATGRSTVSLRRASRLVAVGPVNPAVSSDVQAKVAQAIADLKSGKIKVFTGPIYDNTGKLQIPSGTTWTVGDIYTKSTFFVKGVDGKVSQ